MKAYLGFIKNYYDSVLFGLMLFGILLDNGVTFSQIAWGHALAIFLTMLNTFRIRQVETA